MLGYNIDLYVQHFLESCEAASSTADINKSSSTLTWTNR